MINFVSKNYFHSKVSSKSYNSYKIPKDLYQKSNEYCNIIYYFITDTNIPIVFLVLYEIILIPSEYTVDSNELNIIFDYIKLGDFDIQYTWRVTKLNNLEKSSYISNIKYRTDGLLISQDNTYDKGTYHLYNIITKEEFTVEVFVETRYYFKQVFICYPEKRHESEYSDSDLITLDNFFNKILKTYSKC